MSSVEEGLFRLNGFFRAAAPAFEPSMALPAAVPAFRNDRLEGFAMIRSRFTLYGPEKILCIRFELYKHG